MLFRWRPPGSSSFWPDIIGETLHRCSDGSRETLLGNDRRMIPLAVFVSLWWRGASRVIVSTTENAAS
jgi:hypothetical protein